MPLAIFGPAANTAPQSAPLSDDEFFGTGVGPTMPPPQAHTLAPAPLSDDEFFGSAAAPPTSSIAGAFGHAAERGVAPAAGGMAGFGPGAALGASAGAAIPVLGETGIPEVVLGLAGGLGGAYAGGEAVHHLQDKLMSYVPEGVKKVFGQDAPQVQADTQQHPYATMAGDIAPNLLFMRPGIGGATVESGASTASKVLAHPITAPVAGAGLGASLEAGAELHDTGKVDPIKVGIAAVGGAAMTHETALGAKVADAIPGMFQSWRAARAASVGISPPGADTPATPEEHAEFVTDPAIAGLLKANGITHPDDPRVIQLQDRLAARKEAPPTPLQDAGGAKTAQFQKDQARLQAEKEALGTELTPSGSQSVDGLHPSQLSTAGRVATPDLPPVIPVTPAGQADVGNLGVRAGVDNAAQVKTGIQDQASEAFRLAQLQRSRVDGAALDTQPAARPQGVDAQPVTLDEGFPVKVLSRQVKQVGDKQVEMATVHRYDPRTDQVDPEAVPYDVPVRQLRTANYAKEPRMSQDFVARAEGPGNPEKPRMATDPKVAREPDQTFRSTAPDANADFPGATRPGPEDGNPPEGRSPLPDQPQGPSPFKQRPRNEEEVIADFERRKQQSYSKPGQDNARSKNYRAEDDLTSTRAAAQDAEGRFPVDDRGFVASDKKGPMRFADQKQAAKWIINEGHKKSPDQIFEIENHPSGKGFTVHERGRAEAKQNSEAPRTDGHSDAAGGARAAGGVPPGDLSPREAPRLEAPRVPEPKPDPKAAARDRMAAARAAKAAATRGTLFDAIRAKGGIRDDRGDINQIMDGYKNPSFKKRVLDPNGMHPDKMREALQADGWFGRADRHGPAAMETGSYPGDSVTDLHAMMDREARGEKIYHPDSTPTDKEATQAADNIDAEEADRAGVTEKDTPLEVAQKLAEFRASNARDFQMKAEQAKVDDAISGLSSKDFGNYDHADGQSESDVGGREDQASENESRPRQSDDIPGWESDTGPSDHSAAGDHNRAGTGADAGPGADEGLKQTRAEGTEHEATAEELKARARAKDAQEHQQNPRAYSGKSQKGHADDGLFGDKSEKNQDDMFDEGTDGQKSAAADLNNKFSSNPVFDPETWKLLTGSLTKHFKWPAEEADAFTRHWQSLADAWPKKEVSEGDAKATLLKKAANAVYPLWHGAKILIGSNDGVLRSIAFRRNSKAVLEIANHFFAGPKRSERGVAHAEDYFLATSLKHNQLMNKVDDLLKPFGKMKADEHQSALNQVGRLVTNPGAIRPGTPIHDAAAGIAKVLKEIHTYMREAGVEVGEVKRGYFPRVENVDKAMANPEGFKAAAIKAYRADGVPLKDAVKSAEEWFNRLLLGDLGIQHGGNDFMQTGGNGAHPAFTKGRELSKKADDIMGEYYLRNPADIMPRYITKAIKAAEWERRMGKRDPGTPVPKGEDKATYLKEPLGKWQDYKKRMIAEGAGEDVPEVVRIIKSMTGNIGNAAMSNTARNSLSLVRTFGALSYLPHATMSSLSEPVSMAIRTGNPLDIFRAFGNTVRHWVPTLQKMGQGPYLKEMARDLGFIGDSMDSLSMLQRVGNEDNTLWARRLQANFFRQSGLTQFTEAERISAMQLGMTFMRRLASDVSTGSHFQGMARNQLAELGIGDKAEAFSRWIMDRDGKPHMDDIIEGGDMGKLYHTALGRFISQSVMHPTGALKPRYAQHPIGSLFYGLQSFNYSFQKNILNRVASMSMDAFDPKSGLNGRERMASLMPLATLPMLFGIQYALGEIRNAALPDPAREGQPPQTTWNKSLTAISRSGIDGIMDPYANIITQARYSRDSTLALQGPYFSVPGGLVADTMSLAQSSGNTTTAKRKMMRDIYDLGIKPALLAGVAHVSTETPLLTLLGAAAVQGLSHPAVREDFVRPTAGAPEPPKGSGSTGFSADDFKAGGGFSASDFK